MVQTVNVRLLLVYPCRYRVVQASLAAYTRGTCSVPIDYGPLLNGCDNRGSCLLPLDQGAESRGTDRYDTVITDYVRQSTRGLASLAA